LELTLAYITYTSHLDNAAEVGVPTSAAKSRVSEKSAGVDPGVLAVMACDNWTGDHDLEYVANGLAEDIMHAVRRLGIQVIGRASTFSLKDKNLDVPTIAQRLGAGYVLTCSVRRIPQSLRVSVQLSDGYSSKALWTEDFDRESDRVFEIARVVAIMIPTSMGIAAGEEGQTRLALYETADPDAVSVYWQGRYFYNQITAAGARRAQELYQQALETDPNYADAHAGIADALIIRMQFEHIPQLKIYQEIGLHLEKALELDSNSAAAWTAYGELMTITRRWDEAEQALTRAIDIDRYDPQANLMTAQYYQVVGPARKALPYIDIAMRWDPLNAFASTHRINMLTYMRKYDEALRASRDTMKRFPNFWLTHWARALAYDGMGDYASMLTEVEKAIELLPAEEVNEVLPDKARALALLGRVDDALAILADLESGNADNPVPAVKFAYIHEALGNYDLCLDYLEQGIEDRSWAMPTAVREHTLDGVRDTPRFRKIMDGLGLSEDGYL
jgi:adenylate cyclase